MASFSYDIIENCGTLSQRGSWNFELNRVSWGGASPVYDLRKWDAAHEKMSKGATMTAEELHALRELLNTMEV